MRVTLTGEQKYDISDAWAMAKFFLLPALSMFVSSGGVQNSMAWLQGPFMSLFNVLSMSGLSIVSRPLGLATGAIGMFVSLLGGIMWELMKDRFQFALESAIYAYTLYEGYQMIWEIFNIFADGGCLKNMTVSRGSWGARIAGFSDTDPYDKKDAGQMAVDKAIADFRAGPGKDMTIDQKISAERRILDDVEIRNEGEHNFLLAHPSGKNEKAATKFQFFAGLDDAPQDPSHDAHPPKLKLHEVKHEGANGPQTLIDVEDSTHVHTEHNAHPPKFHPPKFHEVKREGPNGPPILIDVEDSTEPDPSSDFAKNVRHGFSDYQATRGKFDNTAWIEKFGPTFQNPIPQNAPIPQHTGPQFVYRDTGEIQYMPDVNVPYKRAADVYYGEE